MGTTFFIFSAVLVALTSAGGAQLILHSEAPALNEWVHAGVPAQDKEISVKFGLKQNAEGLEACRRATESGTQLGSEAVLSLVKPSTGATLAVNAWLTANKIAHKVHASGLVVDATLSIASAEALFHTTFVMVKSNVTGQVYHRAGPVHVPQVVADSISALYGLHGLPTPPKKAAPQTESAAISVTPAVIHKAYGVSHLRGSGSTKARQAVAEFQGQFSNTADLESFFKAYVPTAHAGDDKVYKYAGNKGSGQGIEALLDIQYIMGVAPGVLTEFWGYKNFDFCQDLKTWTTDLLAGTDIPVVHSISYGWQGELSQIGCQAAEVKDIDTDFMKLAARGISIIFASGDSGSGEVGSGTLYPSWPASSPWVTSVGATTFLDSTGTKEMASTQFGSGSGFSSMFDAPSFQTAAIASFKKAAASSLPPTHVWSPMGRGTADVSALGENYQVYVGGSVEGVGGTSAATPTFSALVSLINDELVSKGGKPLGYLNHFLYNNTAAFNDVTHGSDKIGRGGTPLTYGYDCVAGWDPATGLGTVRFASLLQAAQAAQQK